MAVIQWFPGHMAKALRQIREQLSLVDIVFELVDARIPFSSQNPVVKQALHHKPHLLIMTKLDMADQRVTNQWLTYFEQLGQPVIAVDGRSSQVRKQVTKKSQQILAQMVAQESAKGMQNRAIKAMCVGVPNVGKSTLLNHLVNKNMANTANRPGVTTGQQWLRSSADLELLDTPGVLWPKFETQLIGVKLALVGSIKDSLYPKDDVALFAIHHFRTVNPQILSDRYHLAPEVLDETATDADVLLEITSKLGFKDDYDRASERIITDFRKLKLGATSLETPDEITEMSNENDAANH